MLIYIACPYSKGDVGENIHRAVVAADALVAKGHVPCVPVLTHVWQLISPKPYAFWLEYDLHFLGLCDAILRLPGESTGADAEVAQAQKWCIPIYYSLEEIPCVKSDS